MSEIVVNPLVVKLFSELKKRKVGVPKFALDVNIPKERIYKWKQQGNNPKIDDVEKIKAWIDYRQVEKSTTRDAESDHLSLVQEAENQYNASKLTMEDVKKLINSNAMLAEANKTLAQAHKILAQHTEILTSKIPATAGAGEQISIAFASKFSQVLQLIAEIGSGKKIWKNPEQAREELNKLILVPTEGG